MHGTLKIHAPDGQLRHTLHGHKTTGGISRFAWSADSKVLFSSDASGTTISWDTLMGMSIRSFVMDQESLMMTLALSPDGNWLLTGYSRALRIWNIRTGSFRQLGTLNQGIASNGRFSPDGNLISIADGKLVGIIHAATGTVVATAQAHDLRAMGLAIAPGNKRAISVGCNARPSAHCESSSVKLWSLSVQ